MTAPAVHVFEDSPAVRGATPVWAALCGPSGSGKTFGALRIATGMQRVIGGDIFLVDTEAGRAKHYADFFKFRHVPFDPPYTPERYAAAFQHCVSKGAKIIIPDSFSHVWEGTGGILEMHDAELERLAKGNEERAEKMSMTAWIKPKAAHRRMINAMYAMPVSFLICLRAKEKLRIVKGKPPESRGWMPIASDELIFELPLRFLLLPGSDGVPTWQPVHDDEKHLVRLPMQFREMFTKREQLSEDIGEKLARWAAGTPPAPPPSTELVARYAMCQDHETLLTLESVRAAMWPTLSKDEKAALKLASEIATQRLAVATGAT